MLYEILLDAPRSTYNPRQKPRPHADRIVGSANMKCVDSMTIHLRELYLNQSVGGKTSSISSNPTKSVDVNFVQYLTNPNGNQQPGGNKKKGCNYIRKGGKNNNKPKDNGNNEKTNNNVGEGKKERKKVKFPCNLFTDDHLIHLCSKLVEYASILSLSLVVLLILFCITITCPRAP
jgi:hypothetical protein